MDICWTITFGHYNDITYHLDGCEHKCKINNVILLMWTYVCLQVQLSETRRELQELKASLRVAQKEKEQLQTEIQARSQTYLTSFSHITVSEKNLFPCSCLNLVYFNHTSLKRTSQTVCACLNHQLQLNSR